MSRRQVKRMIKALAARAKRSEAVRRVLVPVMARFPGLRRRLAALAQGPAKDIAHPDWPAPLPAEYLHLPLSARKVLLDLAKAAGNQAGVPGKDHG